MSFLWLKQPETEDKKIIVSDSVKNVSIKQTSCDDILELGIVWRISKQLEWYGFVSKKSQRNLEQ